MASIAIRNLDEEVKTQIRKRAASHGHSMEEEVRIFLREAVEREDSATNPADAVRAKLTEMRFSKADIPAAVSWARGSE